MESCIRISLSEYIDPDQSQRFDHLGCNEIWREPFPLARTCDTQPRCACRAWLTTWSASRERRLGVSQIFGSMSSGGDSVVLLWQLH